MNAEYTGEDCEISRPSFAKLSVSGNKTDDEQVETYNEKFIENDYYPPDKKGYNFPHTIRSPTNMPNNSAKNKRKNFSPKYTYTSPVSKSAKESDLNSKDITTTVSNEHYEILDNRDSRLNKNKKMSIFPKSPPPSGKLSSSETESLTLPSVDAVQEKDLPPWVTIFNHYDQLFNAARLDQFKIASGSSTRENDGGKDAGQIPISNMSAWVRSLGTNEFAISAIRNLIGGYQESRVTDKHRNDCGIVNPSIVTKLTQTPPTTPFIPATVRSLQTNGSDGYHASETSELLSGNDQIKVEPIDPSLLSLSLNEDTRTSKDHLKHPPIEQNLSQKNSKWLSNTATIPNEYSEEKWNQKDSSEDENDDNSSKITKSEIDRFNNYQDNSSDFGDRPQASSSLSSDHLCQFYNDKLIKRENDDTNTTNAGEVHNEPSSNDYHDSTNDGEEDDDNYSVNTCSNDNQTTTSYVLDCDINPLQNTELQKRMNLIAETEECYSNSSTKMHSVNVEGFLEENQPNSIPSVLHRGIQEKGPSPCYIQNMKKFTSYLECTHEVCRIENLREHYHCNDFPCFNKILSKKEEVIRHVKWHKKRMESLSQGFMRFSSSDDCSTIFGSNCQHNRRQTHYHCFQPNCDRVYISTSDVQMHSNFHRKDSAIHKEGFQRYRANETCSAAYCMFSGQKTTHFHCRRDNCQYTFKNKADMEKHKTYHLKDLKLARDGFKKFLKTESCPYEQCRFSKVCNHIHCARENCFYVLHSSGQMLSHKRKHERMDNVQSLCSYKMLAVKAALVGKAAASALNSEMLPTNFTNTLLQLRELEINAMIPKDNSESSLLLNNQEQYDNDSDSQSSSPSSFAKKADKIVPKKHQITAISKQKDPGSMLSDPDIVNFPAPQKISNPQYQCDMALLPSYSAPAPSVIQQFFTGECPSHDAYNNEPFNLKTCSSSTSTTTVKFKNPCPWEKQTRPHLHCTVKDCEAVIPNNILDICAHIRLHEYHRDVCVTTDIADASEPPQSSNSKTSTNSMQITTIDGFFNRKRGRPPKNRFVEVYKNAQQSPQAIFTSFKLEKQTMSKDSITTEDTSMISPYSQNSSLSIDSHLKREQTYANNFPSPSLLQGRVGSQYITFRANEHCERIGYRCSLAMQHHYHCSCSENCTFITAERDLLSMHLERQHTVPFFADTINKQFNRFDRNIGLDCGIAECKLRKTRPHLHCRHCCLQISPLDLETHTCGILGEVSPTLSQAEKPLSLRFKSDYRKNELIQTEKPDDNSSIHSNKITAPDCSFVPSITYSALTELRKKVTEIEPEPNPPTKQSHEGEKVLVVRASGTYFPENTTKLNDLPSQFQSKGSTLPINEPLSLSVTPTNSNCCSSPSCKIKGKSFEDADFCDHIFSDAKSKAFQTTHPITPNKNVSMNSMSSNFCTDSVDEKKSTSYLQAQSLIETDLNNMPAAYDELPQDLSLSPTIATATQNNSAKAKEKEFVALPSQLQQTSIPEQLPSLFPSDLMSISMQNFHLAQLAALYQQNPYYYQHLYPLFSSAAALTRHQQQQQAHLFKEQLTEDKQYSLSSSESTKPLMTTTSSPFISESAPTSPLSGPLQFISPAMMSHPVDISVSAASSSSNIPSNSSASSSLDSVRSLKRKLNNGTHDFNAFIEALSPSTKKQMQYAAGLAAAAAAVASSGKSNITIGPTGLPTTGNEMAHGQHFKIKDDQIPTGYLKFRFNEDCYFPKCGYRNHQSHFHCDRDDCHYSFCDKTRFVQHTARHERLDKLMGNDFRQYRANMNCGYEKCPYFKNLGSANKSSHFHCLKCDFICSDTNKVVAHRRQHSKMEYIRMAGFRKVTNSEKCNSTFNATIPASTNKVPATLECSYSQKQTHYHCLVCDVSVLSRAQLVAHKHKN